MAGELDSFNGFPGTTDDMDGGDAYNLFNPSVSIDAAAQLHRRVGRLQRTHHGPCLRFLSVGFLFGSRWYLQQLRGDSLALGAGLVPWLWCKLCGCLDEFVNALFLISFSAVDFTIDSRYHNALMRLVVLTVGCLPLLQSRCRAFGSSRAAASLLVVGVMLGGEAMKVLRGYASIKTATLTLAIPHPAPRIVPIFVGLCTLTSAKLKICRCI